MQKCIIFALALCFRAAGAISVSAAESEAKVWMRTHQSPTDGQLGELASSNPQAFAIVSALLNKHHTNTLPESMRGPDVFKRMLAPHRMSAAATSVAMPYPEATDASEPAVQEEAQPKAGGKDEVDGLLSMVAGLAGGSQAKQIALLRSHHAAAMETEATPKKPAKDWSAGEAEQRAAASWHPHDISAVSQSQSMASVVVAESAPAATAQHSELEYAAQAAEAPKPKKHGLWDWLGSGLKSR